MELDKRIKALTDIQSVTNGCHDWEFMTKKGYFANSIFDFKDLSKCEYGEYVDYREHDKCFHCEVILPDGTTDYNWFSYFLPEDSLLPEEKPEKKYRPFSLEEFSNIFKVGDLVEFRYKDSDEVKCAMFTGYITDVDRIDDKTPGACELMLGIFHYSLLDLFKDFELSYNGEWQPFGVIDEDKE